MSAPRSPNISIVILTLIPVIALAWSSVAAPCIEIGFFWVSVVTVLSASFYAWCNSDRMGQGGMLLIYCIVACAMTLAVAAVVDIANFSLLGKQHDAQTGVLLGSLIAFSTVSCIAVRSSQLFPASLSWGTLLASFMVLGYGSTYIKTLESEYMILVTVIYLLVCMAAFILLCRCKNNLSDNQYLSVLAIVVLFIQCCTPSAKENLTAGLIVSLLSVLAGVLFFVERRTATNTTNIAGMLFLYFGVTDITGSTLHRWFGINEVVAGIPSVLFTMIVITWICIRRVEIPRGLHWVAFFSFSFFGIISVIPESYSDPLSESILATMVLSIVACVWYTSAPLVPQKQTWPTQFRHAFASCCFVIAISVTASWFTVSVDMLTDNYSSTRLLVLLKSTPIWPGDEAIVRLIMRDGSLWSDDIKDVPHDKLSIKNYVEAIRPSSDRFSTVVDNMDDRREDLGFDNEGIGIHWVANKDSLNLTKVNSGSSAGKEGLGRGDRIIAINGTWMRDIKNDDDFKKQFGKLESGSRISLNVLTRSGMERNVSMLVGINPQDPPKSSIITTVNGNKVGYLYLVSFNSAQFKQIKKHFAAFKAEGVRDLVLDLRYNSGGIMGQASTLANLIGGQTLDGKLFVRWEHAPRNEDLDLEYKFKRLPESILTRRVVVLTTEETCSASENIINGLRPYRPLYTVGSTTCGKPYGMDGVEFGDKTLYPVTARIVNIRGEGDYIRGIKADFKAKDDLTHQLGDPQEGMLKKALEVLEMSSTQIAPP